MPLCIYLCYTPGCQSKMDRWMPSAEEGRTTRMECPRCGVAMTCAWTGSQDDTPNLKDVASELFKPAR
jgi:C4-type Zn-finger protein